MDSEVQTLDDIRGNLNLLREVARETYDHEAAGSATTSRWTLTDYLLGIEELEDALLRAMHLPPCTPERLAAEKYARNVLAVRLYFRGRLCPRTGLIGRFHKKSGEKNVDWVPTELSRQADRLAAEPLRHIYKNTESCIKSPEGVNHRKRSTQ